MKILYVGLKYNYGKPEEGYSYEYMNLEAGFRDCEERGMFDVIYSHPDVGDEYVIDWDMINSCDAIFHCAFNESLDLPEETARLALKADVPIIQWDCDSSWRFHNWILPRKDRVTHFITTHSATIPWYKQNGMNVIKSQWAGSPLYSQRDLEKKYDCTFIGQKHGRMPDGKFLRSEIVNEIMDAGIRVDLFGNYWEGYDNWHGYLKDFSDVIDVFNQSRICLNLSNPWHHGTMPQIKGRHFEIPQVGGLQICTPADDLFSYFKKDEEIVVVNDTYSLIEKIKYYLANPEAASAIATAGKLRMEQEHQWHHRFNAIFKEIGIL